MNADRMRSARTVGMALVAVAVCCFLVAGLIGKYAANLLPQWTVQVILQYALGIFGFGVIFIVGAKLGSDPARRERISPVLRGVMTILGGLFGAMGVIMPSVMMYFKEPQPNVTAFAMQWLAYGLPPMIAAVGAITLAIMPEDNNAEDAPDDRIDDDIPRHQGLLADSFR